MVIFITMDCKIYKITNKVNDKSYIGCTIKKIDSRFREHVSRCKKTKTKFCDALNKYGENNFILEQIDSCDSIVKMYELEKFYIKKYETYNTGYNLTIGGEGCIGYTHSDETIKILKELPNNHKGKTYIDIYGDKAKEEKKKRSQTIKKYWSSISEEQKNKRVEKFKETIKKSGCLKCGKNGFSKFIIIENATYDCWAHAEQMLGMSKYRIKKIYDVLVKNKK